MPKKYRLKKELGFWQTTLYGIGIILGAGIYALIGVGAGIAGNAVWLSFVLAAVLALFTGLSYAELSSMYPKDAAEYVYTENAFRKKNLSFSIQWLMLFTIIVSMATVSLGFAGYFSSIFGGYIPIIAVCIIAGLSVLNYIGMKESTKFNIISTLIEMSGLLIVSFIGAFFIGRPGLDYFALPPIGIAGVLSATAVIFFAYLGFEDMVNLSEETKNASKVVPKALVAALVISTVLYIIVSISAISVVGADRLASSSAPLSEVVSAVSPGAMPVFSFIALFATANTILVFSIVASRMMYGLSRNSTLPKALGKIGKRGTPGFSILIVAILSGIIIFLGELKSVAMLTTAGIFIVFISVNASLIWLRLKKPSVKRPFRSPLNIGKFPVLAFAGLVSSIAMLYYFEFSLVVYEIIILLIGFLVYTFVTQDRRK